MERKFGATYPLTNRKFNDKKSSSIGRYCLSDEDFFYLKYCDKSTNKDLILLLEVFLTASELI